MPGDEGTDSNKVTSKNAGGRNTIQGDGNKTTWGKKKRNEGLIMETKNNSTRLRKQENKGRERK